MEIVIEKTSGIKVTVSINGMPSTREMRDALDTALQQEGYDEYFIDEVFNTRKYEPAPEKCLQDEYFPEKFESALEEVGKTTEIEDKANQIQAIVETTEETVRVLWVVGNRYEIDEAVKALDKECFKGFVVRDEWDTVAIRKEPNINSSIVERSVSVVISTRFIPNTIFTHVV